MHYYQFNIGDYRRDTAHLSYLEHGIYRCLIDTYMLDQSPLSGDINEIMRKHSIKTASEKKALRNVLRDFFQFENDKFLNSRCDETIISYNAKSLKASESAKKRWGKDAKAMRTHSEGNANHKPITNNHKPLTNINIPAKAVKRKRSLPEDFILDGEKKDLAINYWLKKNRADLDVDEIFEQFTTYCQANGKSYLDWDAAWRTWYVNAVKFERNQNGQVGNRQFTRPLSRSEQTRAAIRALTGEGETDCGGSGEATELRVIKQP